jgi:hypothetical protein
MENIILQRNLYSSNMRTVEVVHVKHGSDKMPNHIQ